MDLKIPSKWQPVRDLGCKLTARRKQTLLGLGFVLYTGLVFLGGISFYRTGWLERSWLPTLRKLADGTLLRHAVEGLLARPERLYLDIKQEDFLKLARKRQEALEQDYLISSEEDFVPATVRHGREVMKADLRLKGRLTQHLEDKQRWSYRVRVKGQKTLFGMSRFSLQHPKTRNYIHEWIFHEALRREDILSLRYHFVEIVQNGRRLGIYALEEHFDKFLVENGRRREGPILRFDESLLWNQFVHFGNRERAAGVYTAPIGVHSEQRTLANEQMRKYFDQAAELLERARQGQIPYSKVFDIKRLATYYALLDLLGAQHSGSGMNFKFYYNPVTGLLEPIGFDGDAGQKIIFLSGERPALYPEDDLNWLDLWRDQDLMKAYLEELERVSAPGYLERLFEDIEPGLGRNLAILHKGYPEYMFSKAFYEQNRDYVLKALHPVKGAHAYFHGKTDGALEIRLANVQFLPLEITGISQDGVLLKPREPVVLGARRRFEVMRFQSAFFEMPANAAWSEESAKNLKLHYKVWGTDRELADLVDPKSHFSEDFFESDLMRRAANVDQFEFIEADEGRKIVRVKRGNWNIQGPLIVPPGYRFVVESGTRLDLAQGGKIISYSPVTFRGTEEDPVVVESRDGTGEGILVVGAGAASNVEHVLFRNLSNPTEGRWELTGAVTFYESPVSFSHCQFLKSRGEDALNVIRSTFRISKTGFRKNGRDALDLDFANGDILESQFLQSGNDAVDASGSVVTVQDVEIRGAGDKGISAGERSRVDLHRLVVEDAEIAVASKDLSEINIWEMKLKDSRVGLTVYQKKPEYGPAQIVANSLQIYGTKLPYAVEPGGLVISGGQIIEPNVKNASSLFYGAVHGKASK